MTDVLDLQEALGLRVPPIAVGFLSEVPAGVPRWDGGPLPSGCSFWRHAQLGRSFYTVPSDHYNCAVGAYTHRIDLPQNRAGELSEAIGLMVNEGYLLESEVSSVPRLPAMPAVIAYAPVEQAAFAPDAILIAANGAQAMLIYETALRAGAGQMVTNLLGRPACAVLPMTVAGDQSAVSVGCRGSRMYSGLQDDETLISIPGSKWGAFKEKLAEILRADAAMKAFYTTHSQAIGRGV